MFLLLKYRVHSVANYIHRASFYQLSLEMATIEEADFILSWLYEPSK